MKGDMNMKGILRRAGVPNEHWTLGRSLGMNIKGILRGARPGLLTSSGC